MRKLVLIHGWGASSWVWRQVARELSSMFHVELIDLPGYGKSIDAPFLSLEQVAEAVAACLSEQSIILGWSLGGLIARQIALMFPNKVSALITVASPPYFVQEQAWQGLARDQLQALKEALNGNVERLKQRFCALQIQGSQKPDGFILWVRRFAHEKVSLEALIQGLEVLATADFRKIEVNFAQPQLHLYGDCDRIAPLTESYYRKTGLNYHVITGAAHLPLLSHLQELVAQVSVYRNDKATV